MSFFKWGLILAAVMCIAVGAKGQDKPLWRFSVMASIDTVFVVQFGGLESCEGLIRQQLESVNHIYNDPGVFDGEFEFYLDSLQPFTQSGLTQAHEPHPNQDYHVVYDFDVRTLFNWLYPPDNTVLYRTYSTSVAPFPFIEIGNLVLAHELAHSRGAVDLYALEVDESFNKVVDRSFYAPGSIMSDLVTQVWSEHTILVINKNGAEVLPLGRFNLAIFPEQMIIRVLDSLQRPLPGADVRVYGHTWYNMSLSDQVLDAGSTNLRGEYWLSEDLFIGPDNAVSCSKPLCLQYSNLLLEIQVDSCIEYVWLPFTEPQTHRLRQEPEAFVKTVQLPVMHKAADDLALRPGKFELHQNFPNPFNSRTSICVSMASEQHLQLEITNILGQTVAVVHDAPLPDGTTCFEWDGRAPSGLYFCRASGGGFSQTVKLLLLK